MTILITDFLTWLLNKIRPQTVSIADYQEINRLLIKAGRRCAYDLGHAASAIQGDSKEQELFWDRHHMWLNIFNPADDGKHYRDELHHRISDLANMVARYHAHCIKHGIPVLEDPDTPF